MSRLPRQLVLAQTIFWLSLIPLVTYAMSALSESLEINGAPVEAIGNLIWSVPVFGYLVYFIYYLPLLTTLGALSSNSIPAAVLFALMAVPYVINLGSFVWWQRLQKKFYPLALGGLVLLYLVPMLAAAGQSAVQERRQAAATLAKHEQLNAAADYFAQNMVFWQSGIEMSEQLLYSNMQRVQLVEYKMRFQPGPVPAELIGFYDVCVRISREPKCLAQGRLQLDADRALIVIPPDWQTPSFHLMIAGSSVFTEGSTFTFYVPGIKSDAPKRDTTVSIVGASNPVLSGDVVFSTSLPLPLEYAP